MVFCSANGIVLQVWSFIADLIGWRLIWAAGPVENVCMEELDEKDFPLRVKSPCYMNGVYDLDENYLS